MLFYLRFYQDMPDSEWRVLCPTSEILRFLIFIWNIEIAKEAPFFNLSHIHKVWSLVIFYKFFIFFAEIMSDYKWRFFSRLEAYLQSYEGF